jgi:flagellar basal-body rod protein FlgB
MIEQLASATTDIVRAVLDNALVRHKVIANNIANNQVEGYTPLAVKFEEMLRSELQTGGGAATRDKIDSVLRDVQPQIVEVAESAQPYDQSSQLDAQMSEMAKNTLKYESLIRATNQYAAITKLAIGGGNR